MANLAIKGHATRGEEVIEILEMLGGKNPTNLKGKETDGIYIINSSYNGAIDCLSEISDLYKVFSLEEFLEKFPHKVGDNVVIKNKPQIATVEKITWCCDTITYWLKYNGYIEGNWRAERLQPYKEETMEGKNIGNWAKWDLPDGYEFQDKEGNIINTSVIRLVKKQSQYPKTFIEVLNFWHPDRHLEDDYQRCYKKDLIEKFQDLLYARDAYWKIAGEQMGLGKPWKPDWAKADERKYCIVNTEGYITKWVQKTTNKILAFPTEEMQNAFYENFKDLIELCKELL